MIKDQVADSRETGLQKDSPNLADIIVNSILAKKGNDPASLDLRNTEGAICDCFIICHGNSSIQVVAIAEHIIEQVKKVLGISPWKKEGFENKQWILLDYIDVVVHIFQPEARKFYDVEGLWADAEVTTYSDVPKAV